MVIKDKIGQDIRPGSVIAYGMRRGNSGALGLFLVKEIQAKDQKKPVIKTFRLASVWDEKIERSEKVSTLFCPERAVVIGDPALLQLAMLGISLEV